MITYTMKIYITYIITSLFTAWVILVLLGVSAGFANPIPLIALLGALLLFAVAAPMLVYNSRIGLSLGLVFLIAMLPYTIGFAKSGIEDGVFNWGVVLSFFPALLTILALYLSTRQIFFQSGAELSLSENTAIRFILIALPVGLTLLYFLFYGKYWFLR